MRQRRSRLHRQATGEQWALTRAAADHDRIDRNVLLLQRPHDLARAIAKPVNARQIEADEAVEIGLHADPGDQAARIRIGEGRAVAEKFRHDMDAADELFGSCRTAAFFRFQRQPG